MDLGERFHVELEAGVSPGSVSCGAGVVGRVEGRGIGDALERFSSFELALKRVLDASVNTTKCVEQRKDKSRLPVQSQ